jgi:hypothetical protein
MKKMKTQMMMMKTQKMSLKVSNPVISIWLDNERKHMLRSWFTIFPESGFKTAWDVVLFILIVI